ncbi:MAG: hypothetical protein IIY58_03965 [Aeriscardovia sp.]|nr:hypothetical protein [Aeriscardovia sp.]
MPKISVETLPESGEVGVGVIYPVDYENICCPGKPFILYACRDGDRFSYNCRCSCNMVCTNGFSNPAKAIMQYEYMCRIYPKEVDDWFDRKGTLFNEYLKFYKKK